MRQFKKKEDIFLFINRRFGGYSLLFQCFELYYNSAENEIRYIIVTATERGDRGECRIGFPSPQNPEIGGSTRNVGL